MCLPLNQIYFINKQGVLVYDAKIDYTYEVWGSGDYGLVHGLRCELYKMKYVLFGNTWRALELDYRKERDE